MCEHSHAWYFFFMFWSLLDFLNGMKCILCVILSKLTLLPSWKCFGFQLRYAYIFFLWIWILWYVCFGVNNISLGFRYNHICNLMVSLIYQLVTIFTSTLLVETCFGGLKGRYLYGIFSIGNLAHIFRLRFLNIRLFKSFLGFLFFILFLLLKNK